MRGGLLWRAHNRAELLVDGSAFFPAMLEAIDNAEHSLALEFYLVNSGAVMDRVITALLRARKRGVEVRFLCDGFGAMGLAEADRQLLREGGVRLDFYNPIRLRKWNQNFARDHRKLMIVDGRLVFLGGTGLSDEFLEGSRGRPPWHELMVRVEGPVVTDWQLLFQQVWRDVTGERLTGTLIPAPSGSAEMRVASAHGIRQQRIKVNFRHQINQADSRIWLMTAYFLPSWSIRQALKRAAERGVDVRLILPGPITDHPGLYFAARRYYRQLLESGVRIYEFQPCFLHAKAGICDDWVSIGSCNLDHWTLRWNLEANQEIRDADFTDRLCQRFAADLEQSHEITLSYWLSRPWSRRAMEFVWGYLNAILLRIV